MLVTTLCQKNGFLFTTEYKRKPVIFPLQELRKDMLRDPQWETLNALEQLWQQGFLEHTTDGYLLSPEDYYELESELRASLPLPSASAQLCLEENGNVGARQYSISWYLLVGGRNAGRSTRYGCTARAGDQTYLLNREQYRLILELEDWQDNGSHESRARFQAKSKYLAGKANAKLSQFSENRDFYFADQVNVAVDGDAENGIQIVPELPDIPEQIASTLPKHLDRFHNTSVDGKAVRLFVSDDAARRHNEITAIPPIEGTNIPRFIHNPLSFLPEGLEFDADDFSQRVKGLKARTARVVSQIRVEKDEEDKGWFPVSFDTELIEDTEDELGEALKNSPELQTKILQAAENGEEYVYHEGVWFKIDPTVIKSHAELKDNLTKETDGNRYILPKEDLSRILDIYQNLEGIEYDETVRELVYRDPVSAYPIPTSFHGTLKPYQIPGYQFLRQHYENGTGVLLADDMGLGKTVQIIALLAHMADSGKLSPALIVVPMSLIDNWKSEIRQFLPSVRSIYVHQGTHRYRNLNMIRSNEIVLTTYETLARDQELFGRIRWSCVICDEAQKVKNFNTLAAGAVKGMNTGCRIAVTGTPVENRLCELWSIVDFVQPGLLGSYRDFRANFETPIQRQTPDREARIDALVERISPIFLRRRKEDVLAGQLQPKTEQSFLMELTPAQLALYQKLVKELQLTEENIALGTIQKLMMLCSHPRLVTRQATHTAKASELMREAPKLAWTIAQLKAIRKQKEKAIIFTRYIGMQAMLRQAIFEEFHINAQIINGSVKGSRVQMIREFSQTPGFDVMILSPRAAGVGLNIVAANHVIHYSREWNPAVENQATDRAYRIGQTNPVYVYYPIMEGEQFETVEERLDVLLRDKRELMKSVIIPTDLEIHAEAFYDLLK